MLKTTGTIKDVNETITHADPDTGELSASYSTRFIMPITREQYLQLVRAKFAGEPVEITIKSMQTQLDLAGTNGQEQPEEEEAPVG